jgi:uncharacterized protein (DUF1800 family)
MDTRTAHALVRFGLGRVGQSEVPPDPLAALAAELEGPDPALAQPGASAAEGLIALRQDRAARRARKADGALAEPNHVRGLLAAETARLADHVLTTPLGFRERLVWFWVNHFTVSLRRPQVAGVITAYIREAIRPHVTGRFHDMLLAVMNHPAMLMYLDNVGSIGPDSPVGQRFHRGLNENLARESLELHTVTPASGYTQADVTSYAKILTGWSIDLRLNPPGYVFRLNAHEPGDKLLMGRRFPHGRGGALEAFAFLAHHPATYRNLATKLVRHFVADDPPQGAVARLEAVLRETGGDLKAASLALLQLPEAWTPLTKLRSPFDYVVAVLRAMDLPPARRPPQMTRVMAGLGQAPLAAPLPNGWPDTAADWAGPEAMMRRIDWAYGVSARGAELDAPELADAALGPLLHADTLAQMRRAGSRRDALTLLFASPEFQRR